MRAIQYAAPDSLDEAVALLSEVGPGARVLAGGTDLIPQMNEYLREVDLVVDGKGVPELMELSFDPERGLTLGAAVPCCRIYENQTSRQLYPGLVDAASIVGGTAIQGRASVGGNLCNSGPAADTVPALIAYSAVARIAGPQGEREIPVERFCTAPGRNVLERGELLVSLRLPASRPRSGARYLRFIPRNEMDIAVVGVGASVTLAPDGETVAAARIALGAVGPTPLLAEAAGHALVGRPATEESFARASELAQQVAAPITDMRSTAEHRAHLVAVLTRRALRGALERAQEA